MCQVYPPFFPVQPGHAIPFCANQTIHNVSFYYDALDSAKACSAQTGAVQVEVPFTELSSFIAMVSNWPLWLPPFFESDLPEVSLCSEAVNVSIALLQVLRDAGVILPPTVYMPETYVDQIGTADVGFGITFVVKVLYYDNGVRKLAIFGRFSLSLWPYTTPAGNSATIVQSFEKFASPIYSWLDKSCNSTTASLQETLIGFVKGFHCLERVYQRTGNLDLTHVKDTCCRS